MTISLEERFASLEESTLTLSTDVKGLTAAIGIVNAIQTKQSAIERRAEEVRRAMDERNTEQEERIRRTRRATNLVGLTLAVLLPVASIIVYVVLLQHVNTLLDRQAQDRYASCVARNLGTEAGIRREQTLARLEKNDELKAAHTRSARELATSLINCTTSRPVITPPSPQQTGP